MARTTKRNPWQVEGAPMERVPNAQAQAAQTWKAGEFAVMNNAGHWAPIATDAVIVQGQFLKDQDTATGSIASGAGDLVVVGKITSSSQVFEGFCGTDDTADVAATQAEVGQDYGIHVANNYHTVNFGEESTVAVVVKDIAANYEPEKNTVSTSPGKCKFYFKQAILDASA